MTHAAHAGVSLKNGNFNVGFSDLMYEGGLQPKIERVYNSKSSFSGPFGFGWGWDYGVYLDVQGDGTLVMHENGGGAQNVFAVSGHPTTAEIDAEVDAIIAAKKPTESDRTLYSMHLRNDARFRIDEWESLLQNKKVTAADHPLGTELLSEQFSHQRIVRTREGYTRFQTGRVDVFDRDGHLIRIADANGNTIDLTRDGRGHIHTLADNLGRKLTFTYTARGLVAMVVGTDGHSTRQTSYRYDKSDQLVWNKDSEGRVYTYQYDKHGRRNIVAIRYDDNTTMGIGYYSMARGETVSVVRDRDGSHTVYTYRPETENGYGTTAEVFDAEGALQSTSVYDWRIARRPDGEEYTASYTTNLDGELTETEYDPTCQTPLTIRNNGDTTTFRYDADCLVVYKETPSEITKLTYDSSSGKVSHVESHSKLRSDSGSSASYAYDASGNLIDAQSSDGRRVQLTYSDHGRIATLTTGGETPTTLRFTYNAASRPTEIVVDGVGALIMTYAPDGSIMKTKTTGDPHAAGRVTTTFQQLLELIRPAGVTLSF